MSHNTAVKDVKINDINALSQAIQNLAQRGVNIGLQQNAHYRGYNSSMSGVRPWVITLPNAPYDIALVDAGDGSYSMELDTWNDHIARQVGAARGAVALTDKAHSKEQIAVGQIMQEYVACKLYNEAAARGHTVTRSYDPETQQTRLLVAQFA